MCYMKLIKEKKLMGLWLWLMGNCVLTCMSPLALQKYKKIKSRKKYNPIERVLVFVQVIFCP